MKGTAHNVNLTVLHSVGAVENRTYRVELAVNHRQDFFVGALSKRDFQPNASPYCRDSTLRWNSPFRTHIILNLHCH